MPRGTTPKSPIRAWIGLKVVNLVPHTGFAANVRRAPAEYGCCGGLRPATVGSDWLEGTSEGTEKFVVQAAYRVRMWAQR